MPRVKLLASAILSVTALEVGVVSAQEVDARDVLIPVTTFLSAPPGGGATSLQSLDEVPSDDITAAVGRGYDAIRGRILPVVCVEAKTPVTALEPGSKYDVFFNRTKTVRKISRLRPTHSILER